MKGRGYPCLQCGHQAASQSCLTKHRQAIHEGRKYKCRECDHLSTSAGNLAVHHQAIHEGKRYHCSDCGHQSTTNGSLIVHKWQSIKGRNTAACFVIHSLHTKKVLQDTFKVFMKVESITVKIVVNNFLSLAI